MKQTLGQLSNKVAADTGSYCAFDVADEMVKSIDAQVRECIDRNSETFELVDEFCVVMLVATDPMVNNMLRRKFYAWPFLPKPRTSQTVWLYNRKLDSYRGLWCLPAADTMATLTLSQNVDPQWYRMKQWCHYFYTVNFWKKIREEHSISMLSEEEHLEIVRKKGAHFTADDTSPMPTNPIDAYRIDSQKIIDS